MIMSHGSLKVHAVIELSYTTSNRTTNCELHAILGHAPKSDSLAIVYEKCVQMQVIMNRAQIY